mmetsp:Transcript_17540/g.53007  ORF Transcript_17540/g.53007 Transcript_17540/m.53007 type:complete len:1266 (+) Transcript_17540:178-3975(+)
MRQLSILLLLLNAKSALADFVLQSAGSSLTLPLHTALSVDYSNDDTIAPLDVGFSYSPSGPASALCRLKNASAACQHDLPPLDWAVTDVPLADYEYAEADDLQLYPILATAIVPIYNLPNASDGGLVLAPDVLADIFRAVITRWDHPRIAMTNPDLAAAGKLIGAEIVLFASSVTSTTRLFQSALAGFVPTGRDPGPSGWADANVTMCGNDMDGAVSCVLRTPYSIGYAPLPELLHVDVPKISLIDAATRIAVDATVSSVALALADVRTTFGNDGEGPTRLTLDLSHARSTHAWPISGVHYLMMRTRTSHFLGANECARRRETVLFWRWFLSSDYSAPTAKSFGFSVLPGDIRRRVLERLEVDVECQGLPAYFVQPHQKVVGSGIDWLARGIARNQLFYRDAEVLYTGLDMTAGLAALRAGSTHFAIAHLHALNGTDSFSQEDFVAVPYIGVALVAAFSFCGSTSNNDSGCILADRRLTLDLDSLAAILAGNLSRWLDPRLVRLNTWMALEPYASAIGLHREIVLVGQDLESDMSSILLHLLQRFVPSAHLGAFAAFTGHAIIEPDGDEVASRISATPFSLGVLPFISNNNGKMNVASLVSPHDEAMAVSPESAEAISACYDAGEPAGEDQEHHPHPQCYPLVVTLALLMTRHHKGTECVQCGATLRYFQWLLDSHIEERILPSHVYPLSLELWKTIDVELHAVTCDGVSWIESRVDLGELSPLAKALLTIPASISLVFFVLTSAVFFAYRKTSTIKTAQFVFLVLTASGCVGVTCAGLLMLMDHHGRVPIASVPAGAPGRYPLLDAGCRAQVWLYFLGTTLTFCPLIAKLWRVVKVMINPSMRSVRMRASAMMSFVCLMVFLDVPLLAIWMAIAPPFYRVEIFFAQDGSGIEKWHGSCDLLTTGAEPVIALLFAKQFLLVMFGVRLCHRARHLRKSISDAQAMSFVLTGHVERTTAVLIIAYLASPFSASGSPLLYFLFKAFILLSGVFSTGFFIFVWRLAMLKDELRGLDPFELHTSSRSVSSRPHSLRPLSVRQTSCINMRLGRLPLPPKIAPFASEPPTPIQDDNFGSLGSSPAFHRAQPQLGAVRAVVALSGIRSTSVRGPQGLQRSECLRIDQLTHELEIVKAELAQALDEANDMRDDMTDLRDRNQNLLHQLEDLRQTAIQAERSGRRHFFSNPRSSRLSSTASCRTVGPPSRTPSEGDLTSICTFKCAHTPTWSATPDASAVTPKGGRSPWPSRALPGVPTDGHATGIAHDKVVEPK